MNRKILLLLCLLTLLSVNVFAKDGEQTDDYLGVTAYSPGEQIFSLNAGAIIPLFTIATAAPDGTDIINPLISTNLGIVGGLKWGSFIADNFYLGIDLTGMFTSSSTRTLSMIPISFTTGYYFIAWPFEFPIYLNTGFSFNTLGDYFTITPCIRPGLGAYWNITEEWAVGLNAEYWFIPEIYFSGNYVEQSLIANFLQISLTGVFHF
ncbi:MAG: hypothetical protein JEZ04_02340 [Spirochaetales bacterium]|nr:hypothetical protein [Spirochaetales bacterium]